VAGCGIEARVLGKWREDDDGDDRKEEGDGGGDGERGGERNLV